MPLHPLQAIARDDKTKEIVVASGNVITISSESAEASSDPTRLEDHTGLIRILKLTEYQERTYLVSTGEDKKLNIYARNHDASPGWSLTSHELIKRANALEITPEGQIIVADKFGDVYLYPLVAETIPDGDVAEEKNTAETKDEKETNDSNKAQPILGHVSMLNAVVHVPAAPEFGIPHELIVTADRDEHVRVSRFPQGLVIDRYLFGSKKFVSALAYIPPSEDYKIPLIVAGGGDSTLQAWNLVTGELIHQFPIAEMLEPYIVVSPQVPTPVPAGKRKDKRAKNKKDGGTSAEVADIEMVEDEELKGDELDGEAEAEGDDSYAADQRQEESSKAQDLPSGLAVTHIIRGGDHGGEYGDGVLVAAAGCAALAYVRLADLVGERFEEKLDSVCTPTVHPVLDVCRRGWRNIEDARPEQYSWLYTVDPSRSMPHTQQIRDDDEGKAKNMDGLRLARYWYDPKDSCGSLRIEGDEQEGLRGVVRIGSKTVEEKDMPSATSLYPVLSLLHHPDSGFEEGGQDEDDGAEGEIRKGRGRRGNKRQAEAEANAGLDEAERKKLGLIGPANTGKRAAGRAEIQRRLEEEEKKARGSAGTSA